MVDDPVHGGRAVHVLAHRLPDACIGAVIRARSTSYASGTQDIHILANKICGQATRRYSSGAASAASAASATIQSRNSVIAGVSGFDFSDVSQ